MWWRVCAVWRNKVVYGVGPLLIMLIFGTCRAHAVALPLPKRPTYQSDIPSPAFGVKALSGVHQCVAPCREPEMLLGDGFFVNACAALSLVVNVLATVLIGCKAWYVMPASRV